MTGMTRGELAKQTGLSTATIRYYEDNGILPMPERAANGYRLYSQDYLAKVKFIKDAKLLGYSLKEIRDILRMISHDAEREMLLKNTVRQKIKEIEANMETLQSLHSLLSGLLETSQEEISEYLDALKMPNSATAQGE
ncbi:DNA-binding transcriptional regulator, MerR family [Paenibacillus uliginis N3/975]|uniref:DNA-binding transcriptional regulator, MerR family n=1 Tax=Paenibacillus uliginis N3/975 TaxID=1313296 RepID=A0A1X7HKG6_9BACL|nr:MerR family transcriptional regulator [Paenibacillus uliginis]SMF87904.1 DNA-binding transcriptional regulator, MerR family [Paenibacillus uliginis N3/975]